MFGETLEAIVDNNISTDSCDRIKKYQQEKNELEKRIQDLEVQQKVLKHELEKLEQQIKQELNLDDSVKLDNEYLDKVLTAIDSEIKKLEEKLTTDKRSTDEDDNS